MPADCNSFLDGAKNGFVFFSKSVTFLFLFCILNIQEPSGSSHSCRPQGACSAGSAVLSRIRLLRPPFCCLYLYASPARYIKYLAYFFAKKCPAEKSAGSFTLNGKSDCKFCCCFRCLLLLLFQDVSRKD